MGYTHYWKVIPSRLRRWDDAIESCLQIVKAGIKEGIALEVSLSIEGLSINGVGHDAHENLWIPANIAMARKEIAEEKARGFSNPSFNFCKTARKPYDRVVTACLSVLATHGLADVSSDGYAEDWLDGVELAYRATGNVVEVPKGVTPRQEPAYDPMDDFNYVGSRHHY